MLNFLPFLANPADLVTKVAEEATEVAKGFADLPVDLQKLPMTLLQVLLTIFIGMLISMSIRYAIKRFFKSRQNGKGATLSALLQNLTKFAIWFFIFWQILALFGLDSNSLLSLAGIASVAVGFGSQQIVKDVITGMFILMEDQFNVNDVVTINGHAGIVERLGIRTTKLRSANGDVHIFPNSSIGAVTNMSKGFRRATLNLDFPNATSVDATLSALSDEMSQVTGLNGLNSTPVVLGITDMTAATYKVQIQADCVPSECWPIERELRLRIKRRLEAEAAKAAAAAAEAAAEAAAKAAAAEAAAKAAIQ
ncbi:MAG: mechanosensitive ion channel family protein [Clostridiales bacterium]|jgi:small conductance mechanosensitive channel|nr:mechanosensitive ion channel family protein [Clostridiales bacterium]